MNGTSPGAGVPEGGSVEKVMRGLSPEATRIRDEEIEGPIRALVDPDAFSGSGAASQGSSTPPPAAAGATGEQHGETSSQDATAEDARAYLELQALASAPDAPDSAEDIRSGRGPWALWGLAIGLLAVLVAALVAMSGDDEAAGPSGPAGTTGDLPVAGQPTAVVMSQAGGMLRMLSRDPAGLLLVADAVVSPTSVTVTVDPSAMQVEGTIDVPYEMADELKDAPDEWASGSVRTQFALPIVAGPPAPSETSAEPTPGAQDPARVGVLSFAGTVPAQLELEGEDAITISRWEDGREEVEYASADESTTVEATLTGVLEPRGDDGTWDLRLALEGEQASESPMWFVTMSTSGSAQIPELRAP
jgi:hypothetical protein